MIISSTMIVNSLFSTFRDHDVTKQSDTEFSQATFYNEATDGKIYF